MPAINRNLVYLIVAVGLGLVAAVAAVSYIRTEVDERTRDAATEKVAVVREGAPMPGAALVPLYDQFSRVIGEGRVGYTLQVDETNSVSGMVTPGDRVDILLSVEQESGNTRVLPLLEDINVLATGTRVGEELANDEGGLGFSTMTLELQPQQAERLTVADKAGELRVLLRQREDGTAFGLDGLTENELLRGAPRPVARRRTSGVEFIIGGES